MMFRYAYILILSLLVFQSADAQKKNDTLMYYLRKPGYVVQHKDSADFVMYILPPVIIDDKRISPLLQYYIDGKRKLISSVIKKSGTFVLEGAAMSFFPNGRRESVMTYTNGKLSGKLVEYYPSGKIYTIREYSNNDFLLIECRDTSGVMLTENGSGKWIKYDKSFINIYEEGPVVNGVENGEWNKIIDNRKYPFVYLKGKIKSETKIDYDKTGDIMQWAEVSPEFNGGLDKFANFLVSNLRYPDIDKRNNVTGKVFISFVVEKDGALTHVKPLLGPTKTLQDEAIRVIKLSPPWIPGSTQDKPIRVQYTVPINFTLGSN